MKAITEKYYSDKGIAYAYYVVSSYIHKEMSFFKENTLEERLDYIEKLGKKLEEKTGKPEILQGILEGLIEHIPNQHFHDEKCLKKILAIAADEKNIGEVLKKMPIKARLDPKIMLGIIEVCPNALEIYKEEYDKYRPYRDGSWHEKTRNLYSELTGNEEFQKGLFEMCKKLIEESGEIEIIDIPAHTVKATRVISEDKYVPAKTYFKFKPGSPMRKFDDKISKFELNRAGRGKVGKVREILLDITSAYYISQQEQLEHPEYTCDEIYSIKWEAEKGFAYGVKEAEDIRKRKLEEKTITPEAVAESALRGGTTTGGVARADEVEQRKSTPAKDSKAPGEEEK